MLNNDFPLYMNNITQQHDLPKFMKTHDIKTNVLLQNFHLYIVHF